MYKDILNKLNEEFIEIKKCIIKGADAGWKVEAQDKLEELLNKILFYESISVSTSK